MHVLLLKTKSSPTDAYEEYFANAANGSFTPSFIPVLEHKFNKGALQHVRSLIISGAFASRAGNNAPTSQKYGGLVFTSQRAVEALSHVVRQLRDEGHRLDELLPASLPLYVVGPATARGLAALELKCSIEGEESGNGDALAKSILERYTVRDVAVQKTAGTRAPVLFMVGEQRRDIIPRTLQSEELPESQRIKVDELTVYETDVMESFPGDFEAALKACGEQKMIWVVVFSPTGCSAMLQGLELIDSVSGKVDADAIGGKRRARIATIGPTTRDYLKRQFHFEADVCAEKPSPEGVGEGIKNFMKNSG